MSMNEDTVLCLIVLPRSEETLARVLSNIDEQNHKYKKVVVIHRSDRFKINLLDREMEILTTQGEPSSQLILDTVLKNTAGFVSFWFDTHWSHRSRLSSQITAMRDKHKQCSVLMHSLLIDVKTKQVLVSPRYLNFKTALWCRDFSKDMAEKVVALTMGNYSPYEYDAKLWNAIAPVSTPQLCMQECTLNKAVTNQDEIWHLATPLRDEVGSAIWGYYSNVDDSRVLSDYLDEKSIKSTFNYAQLSGDILL